MAKIYRRAKIVHVFLSDRFGACSWLESNWFSRRWACIIDKFHVLFTNVTQVVQELLAASEVQAHLPFQGNNETEVTWEFLMQQLEGEPHTSELARIDYNIAETIFQFRELKKSKVKWFNILSLLLKFQHAQCSDDWDKIFAYIGIASDVRPDDGNDTLSPRSFGSTNWQIPGMIKFTADYTIPMSETYINFASSVLGSLFPFDILHCAGAFRSPRSIGARLFKSFKIIKIIII